MLRKVTHAGSQSASFAAASHDLEALAETKVSRERVQRWTKRVGQERVAEVARQAATYRELPLPSRRTSPTGQAPAIACVMMDGGRIQIRPRDPATGNNDASGHWRETLVGCCLSMIGDERAADPCPTIPPTFVDRARMRELSREIKGFSGDDAAGESPAESTAAPLDESLDDREGRPETLVKSVVATRAGQEAFGERLVAEAHARGFHAARRKAFVADGAASNWSVHKKHFSHYTPILDFTHAICYVYAAAMGGRGAAGWTDDCQWAQWLWSGATDQLLAAVAARGEGLGPPGDGDETSPAAVVVKTLGYLKNQRARMKYAEYRKLGLPITSSHVESTVKQINRRVKGTEKFWDQGAEPLLQLAADRLTETNAPDRFWKNRRLRLQSQRCYHAAA